MNSRTMVLLKSPSSEGGNEMGLGVIDNATVDELKSELKEMYSVLMWLDKRIAQEGNMECRNNLIATRNYVRCSIDCFNADIVNLGK